ncbi:MAG: hypothetical protein ABI193_09970 [Minicystis sp.]
MPAHHPRSSRATGNTRRAVRQAPEFEREIDPTPTPRPVALDINIGLDIDAAPSSPRRVPAAAKHAAPPSLGRLALIAATTALFVAGGVALLAPPRAAASLGPVSAAAVAVLEAQPLAPAAVAEPERPALLAALPAAPSVVVAAPEGPRADAHVEHKGYAPLPGGVLFFPDSFSSADGTYDLYLHFHGNPAIVRESAEHAGLNALVAVINLGTNSAPYLNVYGLQGRYRAMLGSIEHAAAARGLVNPHLRRVALGSWSGGYGGISRVLENARDLESLDAILVMDGIHCGYLDKGHHELNTRIISPFFEATRWAADGKLLFSITHSEVDPPFYAGTSQTADVLLGLVDGKREAPSLPPVHVNLKSGEKAVAKKLEKWLEPTTEARVGSFHVRGFRGNTKEHHTSHLLQMAATVMPELVNRWKTER